MHYKKRAQLNRAIQEVDRLEEELRHARLRVTAIDTMPNTCACNFDEWGDTPPAVCAEFSPDPLEPTLCNTCEHLAECHTMEASDE